LKINELKKINTEDLKQYLQTRFRGKVHDPDESVLTAAYMVIMQHLYPKYEELIKAVCVSENVITPEIREIMEECREIQDTEEFVSLLLFRDFDHSVPSGISEMMLKFCGKHENAAAVVCGDISAVRDMMIADPSLRKIYVFDPALSDIAKMRADIINRFTDVQVIFSGEGYDEKYSLIISNYLLSDRPYTRIDPAFPHSDKIFPFDTDDISYEWKIHSQMIKMLGHDGMAAAVTTAGAVSNINEEYIRRFFIENGFINTVIALPPKLFGYTLIRSVMIIFSFGNRKIRFIDSGRSFTAGRRINTISSENITEIFESSECTEISVRDSIISENGYSLDPLIYLKEKPEITNAVPFGKVMLNAVRGIQLNADEIDELEVMDGSGSCGYRYLKISDLHDGLISRELPYLKQLPSGAEKYCTSYGDIIISKTGKPAKAAVAGYDDTGILVTGNMYLIRPDTKLVDPYFLLAFLTSDAGRESLARISGGSTLCTISMSALKNMMIPLPDAETQREIAESYREKLNEFSELRELLKKKKEEMRKVYR